MRLTPKGYAIGLATAERMALMEEKKSLRDGLIEFIRNFQIKADLINPALEVLGTTPLRQGCKLYDLILRPQLSVMSLLPYIGALRDKVESIDISRREEIVESAEILIKYQGYIERERQIADKIKRLEDIRIGDKLDYASIHSLSTEARQKLERIRPGTVAQASRIPGISPSDINILLLMLGR